MQSEKAYFFKLILLCGYAQELDLDVCAALERQDPIDPDILDISACHQDPKKQLSVLNAIVTKTATDSLDHSVIFEHVRCFLYQKYRDGMDNASLVKLMYRIACETGWYDEEPWRTLYLMEDYYGDAQWGIVDTNRFRQRIEMLLRCSKTEYATVRCASIDNIIEINKNYLIYRETQGTTAFIDLNQCADFYSQFHPECPSGLRCVGERAYWQNAYYEFYAKSPVRFTLHLKDSRLKRIITRIFGWNFDADTYKKFHEIQRRLNEIGFTTIDLS